MSPVNALSVVGLLADLIGAGMLAYGIIATGYGALASLTRPHMFGRNALHVESVCAQRYDTLWGLGFLCVGFLLQIAASFWLWQTPAAWVFLLGLVLASLIVMLALRRSMIRRMTLRVKVLGAQQDARPPT